MISLMISLEFIQSNLIIKAKKINPFSVFLVEPKFSSVWVWRSLRSPGHFIWKKHAFFHIKVILHKQIWYNLTAGRASIETICLEWMPFGLHLMHIRCQTETLSLFESLPLYTKELVWSRTWFLILNMSLLIL